MKILHLTIKKKWFDMIASGEKKEEYREIKSFWSIRLSGYSLAHGLVRVGQNLKSFDVVRFRNGYSKTSRTITVKFEGLAMCEGSEEWGAEPETRYFVIKLGEIIKP
jgi:hypothetical protein